MEQYMDFATTTLQRVADKMKWAAVKNADKIPYTTTEDGNYDDHSGTGADDWSGINWWTNGFWGGLMWLMYEHTGNETYADIARTVEHKLEGCFTQFTGLHHDVGFMMLTTAVMDYRLTGNKESKDLALHGATILAGRFNNNGQFIRAWNDTNFGNPAGIAIIDCMMNISLLFWASKEAGDPRFAQIATAHANTARKYFIRPDGSACHIVEFDPITGKFLRSIGGQGYGEGSSWSRGQAWALYGFTNAYVNSDDIRFLETAQRVADYVLDNLPQNEPAIIPCDFRQPKEPAIEDSCAACILASGLIKLSGLVAGADCKRYEAAAAKILKTITDTRSNFNQDCDAIVQNCTAAYHDKVHHITMVYADFYYTEALMRMLGEGIDVWSY